MVTLFILLAVGLSALIAAIAAWLLTRRWPEVSKMGLAMLSSIVPAAIVAVIGVVLVARVTSGDCPAAELGCDMATLAEFAIGVMAIFATLLTMAIGFVAAYFTLGALRRQ